jgi:PAS domain S-box-containing protein
MIPVSRQFNTFNLRWLAYGIATVVILGVMLAALRLEERQRLDAATRVARIHGRANLDLTKGFLHYSLGRLYEGPWDRDRGNAMLRQSLREFESSVEHLPEGDDLAAQFRQEMQAFQVLLDAQASGTGTLAGQTALRLSLSRLSATAEAVDARLRENLAALNARLDRIYYWSLAAGVLVLLAQGVFAFRALWARRDANIRLAESEALYRGLIEQSIAGVCIARNGVLTYVNPRAAEIMGCRPQDLIGRPALDFVAPDVRDESGRILEALARGEVPRYIGSLRTVRPDGREVDFDVQANPVTLGGAPAVVGILQDVSEKQRLERERLAALQLLASIAESSSDAIFAKDLEGRYTLFNAQSVRLTGKAESAAIGHRDTDIFADRIAAHLMATDQVVMREQRLHRFEARLATPEGDRIMDSVKGPLFDRDGRITGVFGVSRDITERKRQEDALQESRAQLESIINGLEEGLIVMGPNGGILRMNPAARQINGMDETDPTGDSREAALQRFSFETLDGVPLDYEGWPTARLMRGEPVRDLELVLRRKDRDLVRVLSCNGSTVRAADGSLRYLLVTFTDITARKQAGAALLQAQRLESLGTLAAGIAHDFNNILLAISGNASLASADLPPDHPARTSLSEVLRAGQRASDLVRRILLFARAEDSQRRVGDLRSVVVEAIELLRPTVPARIALESLQPPDSLPVSMDTSQVHQVVVNLVTNAMHAIEDAGPERPGRIAVSLELVDLPYARRVGDRELAPGHYASLRVADDGCGMEPAVLSRIFDPFFTTKAVGRGTGLGLPIIRGIVHEHEGALEVSSTREAGTRIEVYLPLSGGEIQRAVAGPSTVRGAGRRILYIDDERALVFLVTRFLTRLGYQVTGTSDPQEALRVFDANPGHFDLVVTDLSMPQMSGFDVARAIRARSEAVPVIMMSGYLRPEDRARATALGVREILLKPSTVDDLGAAIDRQLH